MAPGKDRISKSVGGEIAATPAPPIASATASPPAAPAVFDAALRDLSKLAENLPRPDFYNHQSRQNAVETFRQLLPQLEAPLMRKPEFGREMRVCLENLPHVYQEDSEHIAKSVLAIASRLAAVEEPTYNPGRLLDRLAGRAATNGPAQLNDGLVHYAKRMPADVPLRAQVKDFASRWGCNTKAIRPFGLTGTPPAAMPRRPPAAGEHTDL